MAKRPKKLKQALKELSGNTEFIEGIFNYCDRWCERCPFTSRCMNYAIGEEMGFEPGDPAKRDIRNKAFWDSLGDLFRQTGELILDELRERGFDVAEALKPDPQFARDEKRRHDRASNRPLVKRAEAYAKAAGRWLKNAEEREQTRAALALPGGEAEADAQLLSDATDVIAWYHLFIEVKLLRAHFRDEDEDEEFAMSDANGSVKVALVAIDRSLAAWAAVRPFCTDDEDQILDMMLSLDRLRRAVHAEFPGARAFKRPGFDDVK